MRRTSYMLLFLFLFSPEKAKALTLSERVRQLSQIATGSPCKLAVDNKKAKSYLWEKIKLELAKKIDRKILEKEPEIAPKIEIPNNGTAGCTFTFELPTQKEGTPPLSCTISVMILSIREIDVKTNFSCVPTPQKIEGKKP